MAVSSATEDFVIDPGKRKKLRCGVKSKLHGR